MNHHPALPITEKQSPIQAEIARAKRQAVGDALAESAIQATVIQHLALRAKPGVVWLHPANGGARSKAEAARFKAEGVVAGAPDLLLFADGRAFSLELKTPTGRVSEAQKAMHQRLAAAGVEVRVAFGLNEALQTLARWGLFRA